MTLAIDQNAGDFRAAPSSEPVCTIGEIARRFGLTHRALRFYESRGLLNPVRHGSSRVYGVKDVERLILNAARGSIMEFAWFTEIQTGESVAINPDHVVMLRAGPRAD